MRNKIKKFPRKEYVIDGTVIDRFELLAIAYRCDTERKAWDIMNVASILFHPLEDVTFNTLYKITAKEIARKFDKDEYYFQRLFKEKYSSIRNGEITEIKTDGKNVPDAWVKVDNDIIPVEVKLSNFDEKALKQLNRYIKSYNCEKGIAVARYLTVDLPANIEFIPFEEFENI